MKIYTLYSPSVKRGNITVSGEKLRKQLVDFFTLYKPEYAKNSEVVKCLRYAEKFGVLALNCRLKGKYKASFDTVDVSEAGWSRIYKGLKNYYAFHSKGKKININKIFSYIKKEGLLFIDVELDKKYHETLSEFMNRSLYKWKQNWESFLLKHHKREVSYELARFNNYISLIPEYSNNIEPLPDLLKKNEGKTRHEVNESLLNRYGISLDDIEMTVGNSEQERKANLKIQLVEFYQVHDPNLIGNSKHYSNMTESPELQYIDEQADWGYLRLEQLHKKLREKYGSSFDDSFSKTVRDRLIKFFSDLNVEKAEESIEHIVSFAKRKGIDALNEKLSVTYGSGIPVHGL